MDDIAAAVAKGCGWTVVAMVADWEQFGRAAGPIRNQEMVRTVPDVCLAFPLLGQPNRGTRNCMEMAWLAGVPTLIFPLVDV